MKQFASGAAASALMVLLLACPVYAAENPFTDVSWEDYFYEAVMWAAGTGVTAGTSPTTFSPWAVCTRAQVATFLWRAQGRPEPAGQRNPFRDVAPSDYFYKAVLWAVENHITTGTSPTTFSPSDPCTYAHALTFLWRSAGEPYAEGAGREFTWYADAVAWAGSAGLLPGVRFAPADFCPRANIVTSLYRSGQSRLPVTGGLSFLTGTAGSELESISESAPYSAPGETSGGKAEGDLRAFLRREALKGTEIIAFDSRDFGALSQAAVLKAVHTLNCDPWLFLSQGTLCSYNGTHYQVYPRYNPEIQEKYAEVVAECKDEIEAIVSRLDSGLTEMQTVLELNDYLAAHYDYDDTLINDNLYSMLRDKRGTCVGYTALINVLLEKLNMGSSYVFSDSLKHMWNVVRVDGQWYHLDATWNDPAWSVSRALGGPVHTWLLLSTNAMKSRKGGTHYQRDDWIYGLDVACSSSRYDHYFWQDTVSPIVRFGGTWYYVDTQGLKGWDGESDAVWEVLSFHGVYRALYPQWNVRGAFANLSGLFALDGWLYLNTDSNLLRYRPSTGQWQSLLTLELSGKPTMENRIFGCDLREGRLVYLTHVAIPGSTGTQEQLRALEIPAAEALKTYGAAS